MKFQNPILKCVRKDGRKNGQAQSNILLQFFQSQGHKDTWASVPSTVQKKPSSTGSYSAKSNYTVKLR